MESRDIESTDNAENIFWWLLLLIGTVLKVEKKLKFLFVIFQKMFYFDSQFDGFKFDNIRRQALTLDMVNQFFQP